MNEKIVNQTNLANILAIPLIYCGINPYRIAYFNG